MAATDEQLLCILHNPQQLNVASLVLSAAAITHRIHYVSNTHLEIHVATDLFEAATSELHAYELENTNWPPLNPTDNFTPLFRVMALVIAGVLLYIYSRTGDWKQGSFWFLNGAGNSEAILQKGELYRLVTALTLHADLVHLLGNCLLGTFVIHFFLNITGNGIGLFLIVLTGAIANFINVFAHGTGHNFVGFSTSIFSVIGMLCAMNFSGKTSTTILQFALPLMAGLALLAFLGSSGPRTDLGGHFFGLATGMVCGNFIRLKSFEKARGSMLFQISLGSLAAALVYFSWLIAFAT